MSRRSRRPAPTREQAPEEAIRLIERVRALRYGRPSEPTTRAMLGESRGTCSLKHLYLAEKLAERHPELRPRLVHRVYRLTPAEAEKAFGPAAAAAVPKVGLYDVHRYLTIELGGRRVTIDATFAGPPWDGRSSMPLACGPGEDEMCEGDPDERKHALERQYLNPVVREPFIAALAAADGLARRGDS
jgi:hypothetical protein